MCVGQAYLYSLNSFYTLIEYGWPHGHVSTDKHDSRIPTRNDVHWVTTFSWILFLIYSPYIHMWCGVEFSPWFRHNVTFNVTTVIHYVSTVHRMYFGCGVSYLYPVKRKHKRNLIHNKWLFFRKFVKGV